MKIEIKLPCNDGTATLSASDKGLVEVSGWDQEAEEAALALGFEPSPCMAAFQMLGAGGLFDADPNDLLLGLIDRDWGTEQTDAVKDSLIDAGMVAVLLVLGADPNYETEFENEPIVAIAANYGLLGAVADLIEAGADVHADDDQAIRWASAEGRTNVVRLLLDNDADVHAMADMAVEKAAQNGHLDVVGILLEHGADATADNYRAVRLAINNHHHDVVRLIRQYLFATGQLTEDEWP